MNFQIQCQVTALENSGFEVLVLPVFKAAESVKSAESKVFHSTIQDVVSRDRFEAELGKMLWVTPPERKLPRILLLGLGEAKDYDRSALRNAYGFAAKEILDRKVEKVGLALARGNPLEKDFDAAVEGFLLGTYRFGPYKSDEAEKPALKSVGVLVPNTSLRASVDKWLSSVVVTVEAVFLARDLVNEPANVVNPTYMTREALKWGKKNGFKVRVLNENELKKRGMNLILAVGMGSDERPRLLHLEYKGRGKLKRKVALVGKGVTFDSGGLSLKPQNNMYGMKGDMAGAAAVLSTIVAASALKLPVELHGIIPLVENLPSGHSVKPGDVFIAHNKKSVEIENTDAEGRLILADAMSYAASLKVDAMLDVATLTGACVVALGEDIAGIFTDDLKLSERIQKVSERRGEKFWPLPLEKSYRSLLKSDVADLKNVGGKYAGATTAALFLSEFAPKEGWAHLDIAGPAFIEKDWPTSPKGATGFGVRTFLEFLST